MGILAFRESEVNNHGPSRRAVKQEQNRCRSFCKNKKKRLRSALAGGIRLSPDNGGIFQPELMDLVDSG